jgi:Domain of unknown function (DUF4384)
MEVTHSQGFVFRSLCLSLAYCVVASGSIYAQQSKDDGPGGGRVMISDLDKARSTSVHNDAGGGRVLPIYKINRRPPGQKPTHSAPAQSDAPRSGAQISTAPPLPRKTEKGSTKTAGESAAAPPQISLGSTRSLGVTIWRLSPNGMFADFNQAACRPDTRSSDTSRSLGQPIMTNPPVRVSPDNLFRTGDRVRLSIESPRPGYLYIVNREVYKDKSFGTPKLLFPTQRIRGGNNYLAAGSPVEFPDLCDNANYFEFLPPRGENKPVAEELILMVIDKPLAEVGVPGDAFRIPADWIASWERRWGGRTNVYDLDGGEGKAYTLGELNAGYEIRREGKAGTRELGQGSPQPQTLYTVASSGEGAMVTLFFWYE